MTAAIRVAAALSLSAVSVSGRALRAEPWGPAKDYMAEYTADAASVSSADAATVDVAPASSAAATAPATGASGEGVLAWKPASSPDSWLKAPVADKLSTETLSGSGSNSMNSWLKAPVADSSSTAAGSIPWLEQATDLWAFAVPPSTSDSTGSSTPVSLDNASPSPERQVTATGFENMVHDADGQAASPEDTSRPPVQQDGMQQTGQDQEFGQDGQQGDQTVDFSSHDAQNDAAAVHVHASGSIGGLFDGGEDRGKHGNAQGGAAKVDVPSHAGGAVVNVRLDSELQEGRR